MDDVTRITLTRMKFNGRAFKFIMAQGLPLALNTALYPIANLQIQTAINAFGVSAIAGNSAAASLEGIFNSVPNAFASTSTVFIGQNLGAQKKQRARQVILQCLAIGCGIGAVLGITIYSTGNFWLSLFLPDDPAGIAYGKIRMFYVLLFMSVASAKGVYTGALQNCGYVLFTSLSSIVCIFGFRMFWMWFIYPHFNTFHMLMSCFLISWTLVLISNMFVYYKRCHKKLA